MATKQERTRLRCELVKIARDQGKLDMGQASTRELIDKCMASQDPIAAMCQDLGLQIPSGDNQGPGKPLESSPQIDSTQEANTVNTTPEAQSGALSTVGEKSGQLLTGLPLVSQSGGGYRAEHIQLRLTLSQRDNLASLFAGLRSKHAQMDNGHHVDNAVDAVRWLIEKIPHLQLEEALS